MTWRLQIRHVTGYSYSSAVHSSYNEARVTPLTTERQVTLESSVTVTPDVRPYRYWDYWGTLVDAFDLHEPHTELSLVGDSVVETSPSPADVPPVSWDDLGRGEVNDAFAELLTPTHYVPRMEGLQPALLPLAALGTPADAVRSAVDWVRDQLRYQKGTTEVTTTAADALELGAGVCQDYAHLTLAVVRGLGIPARYVSGYLYPESQSDVGASATGESHAWVEAWTGEWWGIDPTHGCPVGERHVIVGRGRDYADVTPLKGIYQGSAATTLSVSVELTRLA